MTRSASAAASATDGTAAEPDSIAAVSAADAAVAFGLPFLIAMSWGLPERRWRGVARALAPLAVPMLAGNTETLLETIRRTLGGRHPIPAPEAILRELSACRVLAILQLLRCYRPGGWRPALRLDGKQHVEAALAKGRGAILWVGNSEFGDLAAKMAFHRAALEVSHLSRAGHGFSDTRLGRRYLNRIHTAVEDRYLRARVSLTSHGAKAALQILAGRLTAGGVVSITAQRFAKRPVAVPFLEGEITLAPGAPVLAHKTGAVLLPAFAYIAEDGAFVVALEAPIEVAGEASASAAVEAAARAYAAHLEPYVLSYPGQWSGGLHL